jgi:hypothetical protein
MVHHHLEGALVTGHPRPTVAPAAAARVAAVCVAALLGAVGLVGCGLGSGSGSSTTTKSPACQKAEADLEKVTGYDSRTNPSPTISPEKALVVSHIIVDNPTCFDSELVAQARGALGITSTTTTTSP